MALAILSLVSDKNGGPCWMSFREECIVFQSAGSWTSNDGTNLEEYSPDHTYTRSWIVTQIRLR